MTESSPLSTPSRTARRTVLAVGAAALAGGALTACGSGDEKPKNESDGAATPNTPQSQGASSPGTDTGAADKALAKAAAVPVGGGVVLTEQKLVITQPTAGSFRCFTAVCPHQGCLVTKVEGGTIDCPCHGSKFNVADGGVARGPATTPLAEKKIKVAADGGISLA
ncbi:Rieske (2Fe-2S) protein [Streptomyces sp. NPDC091268]|uniref:Rieske (2Fe-2S) protein n=1 Tax=Streptomyces sp. NPDC091268 TaxID=3365979 RepID=UPI0038283BC0